MDSPRTNDTSKKVNLEDLSKEDLIKKCTTLLQLAQKAKQSKVVLQEEINSLKEELDSKKPDKSDSVSQELIEDLTLQKLNLVTSNEELKNKHESLLKKYHILQSELQEHQDKLTISDNENTSYKRQINRLTDENEQLISDLDTLEKQLAKLKDIGTNQQQQLLELEKAKKLETENATTELKKMLSISLEEIKKLKTENIHLQDNVKDFGLNLKQKDNEILTISEELNSAKNLITKYTTDLEEHKNSNNRTNLLKENDNTIKNLEDNNTKLKQKVKFYHSKIVKFANTTKELRTNKNEVLELFKSYIEQVKNWKEQLNLGEKSIVKYITTIEEENHKLKEELQKLTDNVSDQNKFENEIKYFKKQLETQQIHFDKEILSLHQDKEKLINDLKNYKVKYQEDKLNWEHELKETMEKYVAEKTEWEKQLLEFNHKCEAEIKNVKDQYKTENILMIQNLKDFEKNIKILTTENKELRQNSVDSNTILNEKLKLDKQIKDLQSNYEEQTSSLNKLLEDETSKLMEAEKIIKEQVNEIKLLKQEVTTISKMKEELIEELEKINSEKSNVEEKGEKENFEKIILDLQKQVKSLQELEMRSSEEIKNLADENKQLLSQNEVLQEKLQPFEYSQQNRTHSSSQTKEMPGNTAEYEEHFSNLKRENAELLSEMNEMNQAIKERGENISKLEAHCEEVLKKLQIYETQANKNIDNLTEKEKIIEDLNKEIKDLKAKDTADSNADVLTYINEIKDLKNEIEVLKEKLNSNLDSSYADDGMSTSTISRLDETNRLKELEGSWEERYGKLRNLAVKLKGKVRELTQNLAQQQSENEENLKKISSNQNMIQNLQNHCDKLEDEYEYSKKECIKLQTQLSGAANDISKDKQSLANTEEIIAGLKIELENYKKEKQTMDNWKKQVGAKIQTLRKELEANNVLKKDFEARIASLNSNLESKELVLKAEIESHKHTKSLLEQSNNERKKNSVLSLEMQDYERSAKECSKKIEKQQEEIITLKNQIENQKSTISAVKEQNKLLEERLLAEEQNLNLLTSEISNYKKQISNQENELSQKIEKIQSLTQQLETSRSETEDLSTELSKAISEHQKANNLLKLERDQLLTENLRLQQSLRDTQDNLSFNKDELRVIQNEYEGYKVRAQSVLRQNQNRDVGLEEKLSEEVASLVAQNLALTNQIEDAKKHVESLENANNKFSMEIKEYVQKIRELEEDCEDYKNQFADLSAKHEKSVAESAETLRNLKVHADTLSQCYRQQLADQDMRHNREILELQSRLDKAPTPVEVSPVLPTMPRGEGEGSESIGSNNSSGVHPVPLERLLGTESEQEIERMKKKLQDNESKVMHLTSLLSDTEQDLVKHVQMNKLLKEEIRRQQRSEEREKHAENLEYLKNVVFKFVTLNSGDERSRLVPVLNTILKLSPEETRHLNSVASAGASNLKGWSSYLSNWSSPK